MASSYQGLIFDMDGTLTVPTLDFAAIRAEIGLARSPDLAEQIAALDEAGQRRAWRIIESHEQEAIARQQLQPGCAALLGKCRARGLKLAVVTRNTHLSVESLCQRFGLNFDLVLTRAFRHIKPHPGPVLHILDAWRLAPRDVLVIGDYVHDIDCGRAAGAPTCLFRNPGYTAPGAEPDFVVSSMAELDRLLFAED